LREKHRLRVFKIRVLRKTFGPKMDNVAGEWRRLHKEELYDLQSSSNIIKLIKKNEISSTCSMYEGGERCIQGFDGDT
jgi:hypothetical protein